MSQTERQIPYTRRERLAVEIAIGSHVQARLSPRWRQTVVLSAPAFMKSSGGTCDVPAARMGYYHKPDPFRTASGTARNLGTYRLNAGHSKGTVE